MRKFFTLIIFILMILISTNVFAINTTMEVVEDNVCRIDLNESSYLEKKLIDTDLINHQVTLQLQVNNDAEIIIPSGELVLVIDSSDSMDNTIAESKTRKDVVLQSAQKLVTDLLAANSTSLKIGVVSFSSSSETDEESGYVVMGTNKDAEKVCDLTNELSTLTSSISAIEGTGQCTNLDAGLKLGKSLFTSEETNKYMIVLTDGLPNLAVGFNDLVSMEGLNNIINETKSTLTSMTNVNLITMLTGIDNEQAKFREDVSAGTSYTYGQVIEEVFGTQSNPTYGKFYKIDDSEIEKTITDDIYHDLLPIAHSLDDISVIDYFPQYIVDNFEMTYVEGIDVSNVSSQISPETNSITWTIAKLEPGQSAKIQYNLKLKDTFDEQIIDQILDTNEKVDVNYKDFDETTKTKTSDVTPKIKLTAVKEDTTIAPTPLPKTGSPVFIIGGFVTLIAVSIFFGIKSRKIR